MTHALTRVAAAALLAGGAMAAQADVGLTLSGPAYAPLNIVNVTATGLAFPNEAYFGDAGAFAGSLSVPAFSIQPRS